MQENNKSEAVMAQRRPMLSGLAYVRSAVPDLGICAEFATDFGLVVGDRTEHRLWLNSAAGTCVHVVERGGPQIIGFAFSVDDETDLIAARSLPGALRATMDSGLDAGPRVVLGDPLGYRIELVLAPAPSALPARTAQPTNSALEPRRRVGSPVRLRRGPAHVWRLGHVVLVTPDVAAVTSWYERTLGLVCSDVLRDPSDGRIVGTFMRLDRGDDPVPHHVINVIEGRAGGVNHLAFEVADVDDLMIGHEHLAAAGYEHMRGPGRHVIGSQIFDYWLDPWGLMVEHYTDTDMLDRHADAGEYWVGQTDSPWGASGSPSTRERIFG